MFDYKSRPTANITRRYYGDNNLDRYLIEEFPKFAVEAEEIYLFKLRNNTDSDMQLIQAMCDDVVANGDPENAAAFSDIYFQSSQFITRFIRQTVEEIRAKYPDNEFHLLSRRELEITYATYLDTEEIEEAELEYYSKRNKIIRAAKEKLAAREHDSLMSMFSGLLGKKKKQSL